MINYSKVNMWTNTHIANLTKYKYIMYYIFNPMIVEWKLSALLYGTVHDNPYVQYKTNKTNWQPNRAKGKHSSDGAGIIITDEYTLTTVREYRSYIYLVYISYMVMFGSDFIIVNYFTLRYFNVWSHGCLVNAKWCIVICRYFDHIHS